MTPLWENSERGAVPPRETVCRRETSRGRPVNLFLRNNAEVVGFFRCRERTCALLIGTVIRGNGQGSPHCDIRPSLALAYRRARDPL